MVVVAFTTDFDVLDTNSKFVFATLRSVNGGCIQVLFLPVLLVS
jgi:hypothetical protein